MSARGRARRGVKRARTASRPSESESITRTRRGRSRSPPQDTGNNQAIEMLQLADALSAPQAGTKSQTTKDPQHAPIIDFEQIIKQSSLLPGKASSPPTSTANATLLSNNPPGIQFEEETLRCGADDMSAHVPLQIRQKIWQNQYINIALLLKGNVELQELCTGGLVHITESGNIETRPKIMKDKVTSIEKWTDAFLIFTSIYLKQFPNKAHELLQYMSIIREAAMRGNTGLSWRLYDEQFRLRQAIQVQSWAQINSDLWLRVLGTSVSTNPPKQKPQTNTCDFFNQGHCSYNPCRFPHVCSHCGGFTHGRINCFQLRDNVPRQSASNFRRFRGSRPFNRGGRTYSNRGNRQ